MGVGQLSESDAVDALRLPFYSSSHPTGSHGWRNQFDLGNTRLKEYVGQTLESLQPGPGRFYQGRTLHLAVMEIKRVPELRYATIDSENVIRHYRLTPAEEDLELVLVRLKVQNHTATSSIFTLDQQGAELRGVDRVTYEHVDVTNRVFQDFRGQSSVTVHVKNGQCFDPKRLNITSGTTVSWVNDDTMVHYVQRGARPISIAPGSMYSWVFSRPGIWNYQCGISAIPNNPAQVLVEEDNDKFLVEEQAIEFIAGPFELQQDMGINGWIVFETPKGTDFRDFRWRAGDSITIPIPGSQLGDRLIDILKQEKFDWVVGELGLALLRTSRPGGETLVHAVVLAGLGDSQAAHESLDRIVNGLERHGLEFDEVELRDTRAIVADTEGNEGVFGHYPGYLVLGDQMVIGTTRDSLEWIVQANTNEITPLSQSSDFARMNKEVGGQLDFVFYASVGRIIDAVLDSISPLERAEYREDVAPFLDPLQSVFLGAEITEELTRFTFIITFQ